MIMCEVINKKSGYFQDPLQKKNLLAPFNERQIRCAWRPSSFQWQGCLGRFFAVGCQENCCSRKHDDLWKPATFLPAFYIKKFFIQTLNIRLKKFWIIKCFSGSQEKVLIAAKGERFLISLDESSLTSGDVSGVLIF